jgi:hypothetical protein
MSGLVGGNNPPYRAACNNMPPCFLDVLMDSNDYKLAHLPFYKNTTTPAPVTQPTGDATLQLECPVSPCGNTGQPPCGPYAWPYPTQTFQPNGTVDARSCNPRGWKSVMAYVSIFGSPGFMSHDPGGCSNSPCGPEPCAPGQFYGNPNCYINVSYYEPYQPQPNTTRYLSSSGSLQMSSTNAQSGSFTVYCPTPRVGNTNYSVNGSFSLDLNYNINNAGVITVTQNGSDYALFALAYYDSNNNPVYVITNLFSPTDCLALLLDFMGGGCTVPSQILRGDTGQGTPIDKLSGFGPWWNTYDVEHSGDNGLITSVTQVITDQSISISDSEISVYLSRQDILTFNGTDTMIENCNGSNTHVTVSYNNYQTYTSKTIQFTITLSNPIDIYTHAQNIANLLSYWPLNDDSILSWRTDSNTTLMPVIRTNSVAGATLGGGNTLVTITWNPDPNNPLPGYEAVSSTPPNVDPNAAIYDGSIIGAPLPFVADKYFDYGFEVWSNQCQDHNGIYYWAVIGYGDWCPVELFLKDKHGNYLGTRVSHWTNAFDMFTIPDGAAYGMYVWPGALSYGGPIWDDTHVFAIKHAEIGDTWESQNFGRPCGMDKFRLDNAFNGVTGSVYCLLSLSEDGKTATLQNYAADHPYIANTNCPFQPGVDIVGGECVGGFYLCTSCTYDGTSYYQVGLGQKLYNVPSGWAPSGFDSKDSSTAFGRLKFPNAPSMCGRQSVTAIADSNQNPPFSSNWIPTYQWDNPQPTVGMQTSGPEAVDLFDSFMNNIASNVGLVRIDDSTFTLDYSPQPNIKWLTIHNAPPWWTCDNMPKGEFAVLTWTTDFRTIGEANRLKGATDCNGFPLPGPYIDSNDASIVHNEDGSINYGYASFTQTQYCLPSYFGCPRVACISPNNENWGNSSLTINLPLWPPDQRYPGNNQFYAQIVWTMGDLIDNAIGLPHKPCGLNTTDPWGAAGYNCSDMEFAFYDLPLVECRLSVPAGFPALPSGVTIGFIDPTQSPIGVSPPCRKALGGCNILPYESAIHDEICGNCNYDWALRC